MAMSPMSSQAGDEPELMLEINTTPLIDVMLVLLIMLIITIPIQLHAIKIDMPVGPPPQQLTPPQVVKIDIDAHDAIFFNAIPVGGLPEVERRLREMAALPLDAQPELHLRPDKQAQYRTVAGVMAAVQRLGLTKFGIVGSEQFIE
ncbi:ExbD/TolR family protein [Methylibium sp.]|uniref:ExbD/TolR family protein n=1 Tax=Methylibium sp. TaxID=2067992 RepID=UPI003D12CF34